LEGRDIARPEARVPLWDRSRFWEILVAAAATALFARTVGYGWVYDDQVEIVLNPLVRSLSNLPTIFGTTVWAGTGMETYLYRPLALASYALNHVVSGLDPWSYHLGNVLLHAGTSVLVFALGRRWGLSTLGAGLGGLIFAVHPVHVEVIAPVFGRKDLLAGIFTLVMVLLHDPAARRGGWRGPLPVLAFALALLSKEVGAVGLPLVAAQDWLLSPNRSRLLQDRRRATLYVGYLATFLAYVLVRNRVTGGVGVPDTFYMDNPLVLAPLGVRLATATAVIGKGVALQALPLGLSPDYSFNAIPLVRSPADPRLLGTLLLLAVLTWTAVRIRKGGIEAGTSGSEPPPPGRSVRLSRLFPLLAAWYLIALLPTANVLVTVGTIFGERFLYLPSVAFCLLVGGALGGFAETLRKAGTAWPNGPVRRAPWSSGTASVALSLAGMWILVLALQTAAYTRVWSDDIRLFRHAVASVPTSTKANHKLGEELIRDGQIGPALPYLRQALRIAPDNEFASRTLARARRRVEEEYRPCSPGERPGPVPSHPALLHLLGQTCWERGDMAEARRYWEGALKADSDYALARRDLGNLALVQGDTASALLHLQVAVRTDSTLARAWFSLARIQLNRSNEGEARRALRAFLEAARGRYPEQERWAREILAGLPVR
jgi:tetratricopeptide (TPR) repeat protein